MTDARLIPTDDPRRRKFVGPLTGFAWADEAPDVLEEAIKVILAAPTRDMDLLGIALRDLESEPAYRHDLRACAMREIYLRRTPCWVYFARLDDSNLVKVGRSIQVAQRLAALGNQHGVAFNLLGAIRGDYQEEGSLHFMFRQHRVKNLIGGLREIFFFEPIRERIEAIIADGVLPNRLERVAA